MPFGLRPIAKRGNGYHNGGFEEMPIANGYATSIFNGDPVTLSAGNVILVAGIPLSNANPVVGVLIGARFSGPDGTPTWSHRYVGNAANTRSVAYVSTSEDALFLVESNIAFTQAQVGVRYALAAGAGGSVATGNSSYLLDVNAGVNANGSCIVQDVWRDGANEFSSIPKLIVKWTLGTHGTLV